MERRKRRQNAPIGRTQRRVLLGLGTRGASAANDWAAWYPLGYSQVYNAIQRLGMRGLVDLAGFDGHGRTYTLTEEGMRALEKIDAEGNEDED